MPAVVVGFPLNDAYTRDSVKPMKSGIRSAMAQGGGAVVVVVAGSVGVVVGGGGAAVVVTVVTGGVVTVVRVGVGAGTDVGVGATVATVAGCLEARVTVLLCRVTIAVAGVVVDVDRGVLVGALVVVGSRAAVDVGCRSAEELDRWPPPTVEQAERPAVSDTRAARDRSVHRLREPVERPTPSDRTPPRSTDRRRLPNSRRDQSIGPMSLEATTGRGGTSF